MQLALILQADLLPQNVSGMSVEGSRDECDTRQRRRRDMVEDEAYQFAGKGLELTKAVGEPGFREG